MVALTKIGQVARADRAILHSMDLAETMNVGLGRTSLVVAAGDGRGG